MRLSKDDIWGVRKACVESIIEIGESISQDQRYDLLNQLFYMFIDDVSPQTFVITND